MFRAVLGQATYDVQAAAEAACLMSTEVVGNVVDTSRQKVCSAVVVGSSQADRRKGQIGNG